MTSGFSSQQEVIAETANLLRDLSISTSHGATVSGEHVHIHVSSTWDEESGTYSLLLTCYPLGRQLLDWGGLPILVTSTQASDLTAAVVRLGHRGQVIISNLAEGTYRLSVSECWFYSDTPIIIPALPDEDLPETLAAADQKSESIWPELPAAYASNDDRVVVTSEVPAPGMIALTFESRDTELIGAKVQFAVVQAQGEVVMTAEVFLAAVEGRSACSGRWEGKLSVTEPCHLLFALLPNQ